MTKGFKQWENPNKKDKRDSYRVIGYQEDTKDNFGKKITKWKINPLDDEDIRKIKKDDSVDRDCDLLTHIL